MEGVSVCIHFLHSWACCSVPSRYIMSVPYLPLAGYNIHNCINTYKQTGIRLYSHLQRVDINNNIQRLIQMHQTIFGREVLDTCALLFLNPFAEISAILTTNNFIRNGLEFFGIFLGNKRHIRIVVSSCSCATFLFFCLWKMENSISNFCLFANLFLFLRHG